MHGTLSPQDREILNRWHDAKQEAISRAAEPLTGIVVATGTEQVQAYGVAWHYCSREIWWYEDGIWRPTGTLLKEQESPALLLLERIRQAEPHWDEYRLTRHLENHMQHFPDDEDIDWGEELNDDYDDAEDAGWLSWGAGS